jgi:uncharacterized protein
MHYYIDGYNLLFRIMHAGEDLKKQRKVIIENLHEIISVLGLDVSIVFDSQYHEGEDTRSHWDQLEILFTSKGETADEFILQAIKRAPNPAKETVVTSDKKLAWLARRRLVKTETVEQFISWLNKRYKNKFRQRKEKHEEKKKQDIEPKEKTLTSQKTEKVRHKKASVEESFDFYLQTFEHRYQMLLGKEKLQKQQKKERKGYTHRE